ncbi:17519_t:CDS:2 [Acaulospora morrowiae]|uniref:17519_t:CDS:1 n=1 Tax=Acaulospora morrowiae TaxID=94023 RepID=A0A9N9CY27_9GLOM|nr:17519_t:CDS:2 [Acaulospora morrowiae]
MSTYSEYFNVFASDKWSYKGFVHYALMSGLSNKIRVYNFKYKKCLDEIEQRYNLLTKERIKASSLKKSFKTGYSACYPGFPWRVVICSAPQNSIDTRRDALRAIPGFLIMPSTI